MTPETMAEIHAAAFAGGEVWSAATFRSLLDDTTSVLVGDDAAFALGRVVLDEAEIITLCVAPTARRGGLGSAVLAGLEAQMAARGAVRVHLEVAADNDAAIGLYRSGGYEVAGRRRGYYARPEQPPADAIVMGKRLDKQ